MNPQNTEYSQSKVKVRSGNNSAVQNSSLVENRQDETVQQSKTIAAFSQFEFRNGQESSVKRIHLQIIN
jgi:hypothetical protein